MILSERKAIIGEMHSLKTDVIQHIHELSKVSYHKILVLSTAIDC